MTTLAVRPPITDREITEDLRRIIITALLRRRTWTTADLSRPVRISEVLDVLAPLGGSSLRGST